VVCLNADRSVRGLKGSDRPYTSAADRAELLSALAPLDAVVTAAGPDSCGPLDSVPALDWERLVQVNLFGTAAVVRAALPFLKSSGGRVVTIASTLGLRAVGDATACCASKFGVVGFTRALAAGTAGQVGVTPVVPGGMDTRFFDDRTEQYRPADNSRLDPPSNGADVIMVALRQPGGRGLRELVVRHSEEGSWP
jgi:NAD(P)-dependent dehydrogenase (short-subunit alcohol dehydrogenase family)